MFTSFKVSRYFIIAVRPHYNCFEYSHSGINKKKHRQKVAQFYDYPYVYTK